MSKIVHIIGNGDHAFMFNDSPKINQGKRIICNMPPFEISNVYASVMVDFKMMGALTEGSLNLDTYQWVLGNRPKIWMENNSAFYLKHAYRVREFYLHVPAYAGNPVERATNFNCGHMATHYTCNKFSPEEVHMYGFDSMFDHNMRSITDLYLSSDRGDTNNYRLLNNWRPIWTNIFKEFNETKFLLYHSHKNIKIDIPDNVEIVVSKGTK